MDEFLSFELVAFLLLLCEAVNFLQKSNKPNHSEKISKIVEENRVVIMNQTGKQMMNQRQQKTKIISMLLIETLTASHHLAK